MHWNGLWLEGARCINLYLTGSTDDIIWGSSRDPNLDNTSASSKNNLRKDKDKDSKAKVEHASTLQ